MDDNRLITAADDASIRLWDLKTKSCEYAAENAHPVGILGMYYDPVSGKVLSGSYDGTVKVWDINIDRRKKAASMTARELKDIMERKKIYYGDCIEKSDLVSRVLTSHAMPVLEARYTLKEHGANIVGTHIMNGIAASSGHDYCTPTKICHPPLLITIDLTISLCLIVSVTSYRCIPVGYRQTAGAPARTQHAFVRRSVLRFCTTARFWRPRRSHTCLEY